MSLRILFADDSMTAQNMGKKILTEAGYEVVAVSNGAAAVKKIAERKPDIIILDVYMPGYSGLEVCEKVRASIDTLKTPVLLTVGKMEPYKAEDANRVKADGVIIKPFEASDLLAIVKKLEERIAPSVVPPLVQQTMVQQTIRLERPPDFAEFAVHSTGNSSPAAVAAVAAPIPEDFDENTVHPTVDVPDHMATVSAFSDLLGTDMLSAVEFSAPAAPERPVEVAPAAVSPDPSSTFTSIPEIEIPPASSSVAEVAPIQEWRSPARLHQDFPVNSGPTLVLEPVPEAETPFIVESLATQSIPVVTQSTQVQTIEIAPIGAAPIEVTPIEIAPIEAASPGEAIAPVSSPESSAPVNSEGVYPDTQPISVYEEPEPIASQVELGEVRLEPAAAASIEEISVHHAPAFEPTWAEAVSEAGADVEPGLEPTIPEHAEVAPVADPSFVSERAALEAFPTRFGVQNAEEIPVGIASDFPVFHTAPGEQAIVETEHIETHDLAAEAAAFVPASTDEDFEARVAAAMNIYAEPAEVETEQAGEVESGHPHPEPAATAEDDFEARVAAAMSLYEEPQSAAAFADEIQLSLVQEPAEATLSASPETVVEPQVESLPAWHSRAEISPIESEPVAVAAEEPPSFEYLPPVTAPRHEPQMATPPVLQTEAVAYQPVQFIHERTPKTEPDEPAPYLHPIADVVAQDVGYASVSTASAPESQAAAKEQIAASIEAEMPVEAVTAAAVATGADHELVAQVVHRVMERLKPELIAAIVRELNSQK